VSSRDPRESEHIRLTCESTGGNPRPNVTWYRNGAPLTSGATLLRSSAKYGTTSGLLDVRLSREDNGANFTCDVTSDAGYGSTAIQLAVQCMRLSLPFLLDSDNLRLLIILVSTKDIMACFFCRVGPGAFESATSFAGRLFSEAQNHE